jgi:hypothetical protein
VRAFLGNALRCLKSITHSKRTNSFSYVSWLYRSNLNSPSNSDGEKSRKPLPEMP